MGSGFVPRLHFYNVINICKILINNGLRFSGLDTALLYMGQKRVVGIEGGNGNGLRSDIPTSRLGRARTHNRRISSSHHDTSVCVG